MNAAAMLTALGLTLAVLSACAEDDADPASSSETKRSEPSSEATSTSLPEGRIAFRRFTDGGQDTAALFTMSTDGSDEAQVTEPPAGVRDALPDWSPDGKSLAFQREYDDKPYEVYVVGADGSGEQHVDPACPAHVSADEICEEMQPAWTPDGSRLVFSWPHGSIRPVNGEDTIEVFGVATMSPDGSSPRLLTQTTRPTSAEDATPVVSPDGSQIAFVRLNITAKPVDQAAIFVMNADGSGERRITPWNLRAADIDWSPDGSLISFRSENHGADNVGDIYTVRPDGSGITRLTDNRAQKEVFASSFSPDSEWLVFAMTGVEDQPDLWVMRADGSDLAPLTATAEYESAPDWSPR